MGKPTGFMDYKRQELALRAPEERINDWQEIKTSSLPQKEALRCQAARCMDCGVPFCHSGLMIGGMVSGCPLHNLMPEFNDLVYHGMDAYAYARLNKTNNFPEFTSHVCPAPCEGACNAGLVNNPVTIRNLEQYIIENAFEQGLVQPNIPAQRTGKRVAVIGSGPAGLACADELNKAGHSVTVYERADRAGGLLMYGVPNMKLDKQIVERRVKLLEAAGVEFVLNSEVGVKLASTTLREEFDAVVLCTGATVPRDLPIKGRELKGIYFAKDYLESVTKSLLNSNFADGLAIDAKDKDVVIIGGGDTGNDCAGTSIRQGALSALSIDVMPKPPAERSEHTPWPLWPYMLRSSYAVEEGLERFWSLNTLRFLGEDGRVTGAEVVPVSWEIDSATGRPVKFAPSGPSRVIPCDMVVLAMGFLRQTRQQVLESLGLPDSPNIAIAGDAASGPSLVVRAIADGIKCARELL